MNRPKKMPNQNSGYSIIIPQVKDTVPPSEQKRNKKGPHSDVNSIEQSSPP